MFIMKTNNFIFLKNFKSKKLIAYGTSRTLKIAQRQKNRSFLYNR